jgi:hypothetical protein
MAEHDDTDNLFQEMEQFLQAVARRQPNPSHPINLKIEYKNNLRVTDKNKHSCAVDESVLSAFRDTYTDKNCTFANIQTNLSVCSIGNSRSTSTASSAPKLHSLPKRSSSSAPRMSKRKYRDAISRSISSKKKRSSRNCRPNSMGTLTDWARDICCRTVATSPRRPPLWPVSSRWSPSPCLRSPTSPT